MSQIATLLVVLGIVSLFWLDREPTRPDFAGALAPDSVAFDRGIAPPIRMVEHQIWELWNRCS